MYLWQEEEGQGSIGGSDKGEEDAEDIEEDEDEYDEEEEEEEDDDRPRKKPKYGGFILDEAGKIACVMFIVLCKKWSVHCSKICSTN